jgi:hypothetical protein
MRIDVDSVLTGDIMKLEVYPSDTVGSVKEVVCQSLMVSPGETMLVYNGKPLQDRLTMTQAGIIENSMLQLMLATLEAATFP